jgi:hypothetical protein
MKKYIVVCMTAALAMCLSESQAQNVGIGETAPGAKLVIKGAGLGRSLLVKNSADDSMMMVDHLNVQIGGVHATATGILSISNKHYLPSDPYQLQLVAGGERSGINANGSLCMLQMMNANTNKSWNLSSYAGADAASRNFSISFHDPDAGIYDPLIYVKAGGDIGIGNFNPTQKLDVTGNVRLTGEMHRSSTGTANMLPIAYGNVSAAGFIHTGSTNFTVSKLTTGWYAITITGESYQFQIYTALVTPVGSTAPIITSTGSGGGNLHVYTFNTAGTATDSQFNFVVYKQ